MSPQVEDSPSARRKGKSRKPARSRAARGKRAQAKGALEDVKVVAMEEGEEKKEDESGDSDDEDIPLIKIKQV